MSNPNGLGRRCLQLISSIYKQNKFSIAVVQHNISIKLLEKLAKPLVSLHDPISWQITAQTVLDIITHTLPLVEYNEDPDRFYNEINEHVDSHTWRQIQNYINKKFVHEFWENIYECTKNWFENLSSATKTNTTMSPQQTQVLIELDRRYIEFLRQHMLPKKKKVNYKNNEAIQNMINIMKETANGKSGEVLGLESQRQVACANRCFQALVKFDYLSTDSLGNKLNSISSHDSVDEKGRPLSDRNLKANNVFNRAKVIINQYIQANSGLENSKSSNSRYNSSTQNFGSDQLDKDSDLSITLDTISRIMLCLKNDDDIDAAIDLYPHLVGLVPYATDSLRFQLCSTLLEFQSLFPT